MRRTWWRKHEGRRYGRTRHATVSSRQGRGKGAERAIPSMMRRRVLTTRACHGVRTSCESTVLSAGSIRPTRTRRRPSYLHGTRILGSLPSASRTPIRPSFTCMHPLEDLPSSSHRLHVFASLFVAIVVHVNRSTMAFPFSTTTFDGLPVSRFLFLFSRKGRLQPIEGDALRHTFTRGCSDTTRGSFLGRGRIDVKRPAWDGRRTRPFVVRVDPTGQRSSAEMHVYLPCAHRQDSMHVRLCFVPHPVV